MMALVWLMPVALGLGLAGLVAFLWAMKSGQFSDLEGAGWRAIEDNDAPIARDEKQAPPKAG
jgi:cbb3-type cytochrome oxidase maturation protein